MKIPLSWLKEYLPTKLSLEEISETLTVIGLEVEGTDAESYPGDVILEIALTPNLPHCTSVRGIARELAAVTEEKLHAPKYASKEKKDRSIEALASVSVENKSDCPRYACRLIEDVKVAPSPDWLKERIEKCGMRSVNNVVDITNLVLLEFGHPLHAFDFDKLHEKRIVVRNAKKGETLVTLDGKEHFPTEETLLICDGKEPVAIAGVMGTLHTEVTEKTTNVLLESAYFEPTQVRRTGKRMGIHTEASYRFERGADPNAVLEALERASAWICEIASGTVVQGLIDIKEGKFPPPIVSCRLSRINKILGTQLAMSEVETIFRRLGFGIHQIKGDLVEAAIPTFRQDIRQEIDLIEEVARLYGFDNIHKKERAFYRTGNLPHSSEYLFEKKVRSRLISEGLQEFLTCDLISPTQASWISSESMPSRALIKLLNPSSLDQSVMRPSLLPGLVSVVKYNTDHDIRSLSGFEVGRVHFTSKGSYFEPTVASIVLTGLRAQYHWETKKTDVDFYDLKGIVENLLASLKVNNFYFQTSQHKNFHPGRQAALMIEDVEIGILGELHPLTLKQIDLEQPVYFAEFNLEDLFRFVKTEIKMEPLPQYPASDRDWTVTLNETQQVGSLFECIKKQSSDLLESFFLLDVYRSDKLGSDRKNVTFRFIYRDKGKTISVADVENEHHRITQNILHLIEGEPS